MCTINHRRLGQANHDVFRLENFLNTNTLADRLWAADGNMIEARAVETKMKSARDKRPAEVELHIGKASRFPLHITVHTLGPMTEFPPTPKNSEVKNTRKHNYMFT